MITKEADQHSRVSRLKSLDFGIQLFGSQFKKRGILEVSEQGITNH